MPRRSVPLIVVASASATLVDDVAARLRLDGSVVYATHSAEGCLRVATSIAPDVILLDPALPQRLPQRLEDLLRAHPASGRAEILHLTAPPSALRVPRVPLAAGPHAA
jgi:CheY-like chemotaxis protein